MRIVHIVPGLEDPTCGIAVAAKIVAARQRAAGNDVELVDARDFKVSFIARHGISAEYWLHSMWSRPVLSAAWHLGRCGAKMVRMPHGCADPVKLAYHGWRKKLAAIVERRLFRRANAIAVTAAEEKTWMENFLGTPHAPFLEINLVERSSSGAASVSPPVKLLFIGRLHPLKGVEYLVRAMHPSQQLAIIGKDEGEGEKILSIARERKLQVRYLGIVDESTKSAELARCDMLVLPTLSENFGLVAAEALAAGKRVLTTDGAPYWKDHAGVEYIAGFVAASPERRVELLKGRLIPHAPLA